MIRSLLKTALWKAPCARACAAISRRPAILGAFPRLRGHIVSASTVRQTGAQGQQRCVATSDETTGDIDAEETPLVYESPLGSAVSKLRTVSLTTAIIGATGVPCMIAMKGAIPEAGMLAVAMMFVTGSVGSTAAIHFVFSPYVYRIERIPIRKCHVQKQEGEADSEGDIARDKILAGSADITLPNAQNFLLRAWTRSLFLRHQSVVFDPEVDVETYSGLRPLCNFLVKGQPRYVHPGK